MKRSMYAMISKDFHGVISNRRWFASLLIVPIVLTVLLPSVFVIAGHFSPDDLDLQQMLSLLPESIQESSLEQLIHRMLLNYILPVFFLMIPIMTASIMAASSFVGEKEKRTLETLFYAPLTLKEIFRAKVLACFLVSMLVSLISFAAMLLVLEIELFLLTGSGLLPGISWLVILLLVSPAISLIAVTLIVRQSAKAKTAEESQQGAVFLIVPVILLAVGQLTGVLMLSFWILLGLGVLCALAAVLLLKRAMGSFTYEKLLT